MTIKQGERLLKFLYLKGYEMVEIDQVMNSEAIDIIYFDRKKFGSMDISKLMRDIHFRKMNAESDLKTIGTPKEIKTYKQLEACEKLIDGYIKDLLIHD